MVKTDGVNEGLGVGDPGMDGEHGLQLRLVQDLWLALETRDREGALELLGRLRDFTNAHFLAEQILMRRHAYPAYEAHRAEHDRLVDELDRLHAAVAGEEPGADAVGAASLRSWLQGHIVTEDRAFAAFLAGL